MQLSFFMYSIKSEVTLAVYIERLLLYNDLDFCLGRPYGHGLMKEFRLGLQNN